MEIIDIDKLFDKYIEGYVYANVGKIKAEEIENQIPVLYDKFGNESFKELGGKTPNEYYKAFSMRELLDGLKEHIEKKVAVSDFICEAIMSKKDEAQEISRQLLNDEDEEYTVYLMNILNDMGGEIPVERYLEFALYDYSESIGELATEVLCEKAESVKEMVLGEFNDLSEEKKERAVEILSNCKKDDRVFAILIDEFIKRVDNIPLYVSYLVKYGDEKALPYLMTAIENERLNYVDFKELQFAIEAFGGEYTKKRDFSKDKAYKKIKAESIKREENKD